jgi:hypothetical protein
MKLTSRRSAFECLGWIALVWATSQRRTKISRERLVICRQAARVGLGQKEYEAPSIGFQRRGQLFADLRVFHAAAA